MTKIILDCEYDAGFTTDAQKRRAQVKRMRDLGFKFREIGERLGVSHNRARQIYQVALRRARWIYHDRAEGEEQAAHAADVRRLAMRKWGTPRLNRVLSILADGCLPPHRDWLVP